MYRALFVSIVLVALAAVVAGGCGRVKPATPAAELPAAQVKTVTVEKAVLPEVSEATGTVEALQTADLAPKVMGRVKAVLVHEGDRVHAGQVLVQLDDADLRAAVAEAQAGVKQAQAHYAQATTSLGITRTQTSVDVQQARQQVAAAQAQYDKVRQGPRPQQVKQAEDEVTAAKAKLEQAKQQYDLMREGYRKQQKAEAAAAVAQAQAQVTQAQSGLVEAQANLQTTQTDYDRIKALYDEEVVPKQRLDHMQLQLTSAKEQVKRAQAQVTQAKAAEAQASAQKGLVFEGFRSQEVRQAEEAVNQAQAGYNQAQQDLDMARQGGRKEDVAAAQAKLAQAQQGLRSALAAQARVKLGGEDVNNAAAAVSQAEASAQAARVMLDYATICAPFSGVVSARNVDPGDMASPGVPLVRVEDDSLYRLVASVPESQAALLRVGTPVQCIIDSLGGATLPGRVSEVVPAADPSSRTLTVKVDLPHGKTGGAKTPALALKSGLFGRLRFTVARKKAIAVPAAAVVQREGITGAWVVADGTVTLRMIRLGKQVEGKVEVISGLQPGEVVVVEGGKNLREGQKVVAQGAGQ